MKKSIEQEVNDNQVPMIISVPENSVKLQIIATMMDDDMKTFQATNTYNLAMIREGMIDGWEWENENAIYELTEEGRKYAEEFLARQ